MGKTSIHTEVVEPEGFIVEFFSEDLMNFGIGQ